MPLFIRFLFTFLVIWTSLHGDWFNIFSFLNEKESIPFSCSHQCGQWGSKEIQDIEWEFILLLYQADKIGTFLSKYSKPYDPKVLKDPSDFVFSYSKPQDFHSPWYQAMIRHISESDWIRLGIDDLDTDCPGDCDDCEYGDPCEYYDGSRNYVWGIQPIETEEKAHVGKIFIRKECNYVEEIYDEEEYSYCYGWYHQKGDSFFPCLETQYRFDHLVDFKDACFTLNQELIWLRDSVHGLNRFAQKQQIRSISDMQYKEFLTGLEDLEQRYSKIFSSCAENHQAPSAFYHMALEHFEAGDHARGLQYIENVFERVDLSILEPHLASKISFSQGSIQNEIALYDEALLSLKKALDHDPENKKVYFDQALVLFEQGKFEESVENYLHSKHSLELLDETNGSLMDFSLGLIQGITTGATYSLADFIPSMCSSLHGLSHGLWAFACSPKEVSQEMVRAAQSLVHFLSSQSALETFQTIIPELKELRVLDPNEHQERGKIIGNIIGKYGMEFLTCCATIKGFKLYRELKQANGALTLHAFTHLEKGEKLQAVSLAWWERTAPVIEEIKTSGGRFGDKLYKAFRKQSLSELQVRRILHTAGFKTFPKPKGIPNNVIVQISEKNGGMIYIKAGTTKEESILVRVMPGNPNSPNPMQRKPYVVQRRGKDAVTRDGVLVDSRTSEAHIPLEEFEFKEW